MTTIVDVGTAADTSDDIVIADGSSATFSLILSDPNDRKSFVTVKIKQGSDYQPIGYIRAWPVELRAYGITTPGTYQFQKGVTASPAGVDQS